VITFQTRAQEISVVYTAVSCMYLVILVIYTPPEEV